VLELYQGTYDFTQFSSTDDARDDKIRTVDAVFMQKDALFGAEKIVVVGKKFLHNMVRRMVGTALHVATQPHAKVAVVQQMLERQLKTDYTLNAPAQGLMLYSVTYDDKKV
jgi:tRNA pseudouridine(38-40) synthase